MKFSLVLLASLFASIAMASQTHYKLEANVFIDGKLVSSPQIVMKGPQEAEIRQTAKNPNSNLILRVVASNQSNDNNPDGIRLQMVVKYRTESGTVTTTPDIVAMPGHEFTIAPGDANSNMQIKFVATRE
jgi:hypothetical protein